MYMTDGSRTIEIRMMVWTGNGYTPDFSDDFFDAGGLPVSGYVNDAPVRVVADVDYCIDQARGWEAEYENNTVFVDDAP